MRIKPALPLLVVVLLSAAGPASASEPAKVPDCSANPACRSLFEQAKEQSAQGNLPEALRFYRLAYEVRTDPALLFSIARVLHKQDQTREAALYYHWFLQSPLDDPEPKRKAQEYLEQVGPLTPEELQASAQGPAARPLSQAGGPLAANSLSPSGSRPEAKPVYKKWWFWAALGGATLAAGGIITGVFLITQETVPNGTPGAVHIRF